MDDQQPDFIPPLPDEPEPELPRPDQPIHALGEGQDEDDDGEQDNVASADGGSSTAPSSKDKGKMKSTEPVQGETAPSHDWQAVWGAEQNGKSARAG